MKKTYTFEAKFSDEVLRIKGKDRDLVVIHEYPPIPDRNLDYAAYYADEYDEGDPIGTGPTPEAAVKDFYFHLSVT